MNFKLLSIILFTILTTDIYAADVWTQKAEFPGGGRHRGTAISIGTKGYMGLGHYNGAGPNIILADWWEFDPATNSWSQKANYNGNGAIGTYAALSFGIDGYGYVGGGQVASNASFHRYDPSTNTWTPVANMPTISANTQGFAVLNKGYYMTGSTLYEYQPAMNIWTAKNPTPFSISIWNTTFIINNRAYVKTTNSLWEYKPLTDEWISRAAFPGTATGGSVGLTQNGKGYIVCGYAGGLAAVVSEVWEFDPGANSWSPAVEFYGNSRRFAAGFNIGERAYFGIGTNGTNFGDLWEFDAIAGIESVFNEDEFSCFPNPATDKVNFSSENISEFNIKIYDALGRLNKTESSYNSKIELSCDDLNSGMYHYHVLINNEVVHVDKLIIK